MTDPQEITAVWGYPAEAYTEENEQASLARRMWSAGGHRNRIVGALLGAVGLVWIAWAAWGDWESPEGPTRPVASAAPPWQVLPVPTLLEQGTTSTSAEPTVAPSPAPISSASATVLERSIVAATVPATVLPSVTSSATTFTPISVQAEDPGNVLVGSAARIDCATCEGGQRVGYVGAGAAVIVPATLPVAGIRTVTVFYEADGSRQLRMAVNGTVVAASTVSGPDWQTPQAVSFTVHLPAGSVELAFDGDPAPSADIDMIIIG